MAWYLRKVSSLIWCFHFLATNCFIYLKGRQAHGVWFPTGLFMTQCSPPSRAQPGWRQECCPTEVQAPKYWCPHLLPPRANIRRKMKIQQSWRSESGSQIRAVGFPSAGLSTVPNVYPYYLVKMILQSTETIAPDYNCCYWGSHICQTHRSFK